MLCLTRRIGESVCIDGEIKITVLALGDGRVRLGIIAPEETRVDREEVAERKAAELLSAACGPER